VSELRRILFNDLSSLMSADDLAAVTRVLNSGWLILGNEVQGFETEWATRCGVPSAVGVGNGLDAIEIGLRSTGIGPGDEVITTPMTAVATVLGIMRAGATPVLADINPDTGLLDLASVERCLTPATRAVLVVHLYGQMRDMHLWEAFCAENNIELIEDCAQSHDASYEGRMAGSWGLFGAYSFYPTKNLGGAGDAGAIVTHDDNLASRARALRNYGQSDRYLHPHVGLNSRLDELQAAILSARLPRLAGWTARRREIAATYRDQISNPAVGLLAAPNAPENHVYHLFVLLTEKRAELQAHLRNCGIETLIHYPIPAHQQPSLTDLTRDPAGLGVAEAHSSRCLSLPCAPHLTDEDVLRVIEAVNTFKLS
jgi:dTDP-4-amino-4,6-dideoxygalactose transaminase